MCVCQVSVCARKAGEGIAAGALSPKQPANPPMACNAVGGEDACVASVCVMTPDTPETSVKDVLLAKAPANHTGTFFCSQPKCMMGTLKEEVLEGLDVADSALLSGLSQAVCGLPPVSRPHTRRGRILQQHLCATGGLHGS